MKLFLLRDVLVVVEEFRDEPVGGFFRGVLAIDLGETEAETLRVSREQQ